MRIKHLLSQSGMSSKELAVKCELSEMGLSKIMTGRSHPNYNTIIKLAKALNVTCGELFDDYKEIKPSDVHSVVIDGIEYVPKVYNKKSRHMNALAAL